MIGLADLRQWVVVLGDAARGRVPASLVGPEQEPDDKQLDGYLLRAAILSGAAHWVRGRLLPADESAYQAAGLDTDGSHQVRVRTVDSPFSAPYAIVMRQRHEPAFEAARRRHLDVESLDDGGPALVLPH